MGGSPPRPSRPVPRSGTESWKKHAFACGGQSFKQRTFVRGARSAAGDVTVLSEYEVRRGKMNLQFKANVENQDRAQCGQNEAGGMISFV